MRNFYHSRRVDVIFPNKNANFLFSCETKQQPIEGLRILKKKYCNV